MPAEGVLSDLTALQWHTVAFLTSLVIINVTQAMINKQKLSRLEL